MKKAVKIVVIGTVQGVFYRGFCKKNADELGLTGFIRNLEDGNAELMLEGEQESIRKMLELCKKGPPHSMIKDIKIEEKNWSGDFKEFRILRF